MNAFVISSVFDMVAGVGFVFALSGAILVNRLRGVRQQVDAREIYR